LLIVRSVTALITGSCLTAAGFLCAPASIANEGIGLDKARIELGAGSQYWNYQEWSKSGAELNQESGLLAAKVLELNLPVAEYPALFFDFEYSGVTGNISYEGATQSGVRLLTDTDENVTRVSFAARKRLSNDYSLSVGVESRRWQRDIRPTLTTLALSEHYDFNGITFSAGHQTMLNDWTLEITGRGVWWLSSSVAIDLREVGFGEIVIPLKDGYSVGASLAASYAISEAWRLEGEYHVERLYFPYSDAVSVSNGQRSSSFSEPEITHLMHTATVSLVYFW